MRAPIPSASTGICRDQITGFTWPTQNTQLSAPDRQAAAVIKNWPRGFRIPARGGSHPIAYERPDGHRFLHRGGAHLARVGNLLCIPALRDAPRHSGWNYPTSNRGLDGIDGSPGRR
jgi:hypothetical protein